MAKDEIDLEAAVTRIFGKPKKIESVDTRDGVTTITYSDGSTEVRHDGGVITAKTVTGGVRFTR